LGGGPPPGQLVTAPPPGPPRRWLKGPVLATVDRLSGVVLVGFGMVALVRAAYG